MASYNGVDITNGIECKHQHSASSWTSWYKHNELDPNKEWYIYTGNRCRPMIKFTTPSIELAESTKTYVELSIPWWRTSGYSSSGTVFLKLHEIEEDAEDRTKSKLPSDSNCDAFFSVDSKASVATQLSTVIFENLAPNKTYYVVLYGTSGVNYTNIGVNTATGQNTKNYAFSATYNYEFESPSLPNIEIIDNYNNTFTINVTKGADGLNNIATGVGGLYYKLGTGSNKVSFKNGTTVRFTPTDKQDTIPITVQAYTVGSVSGGGIRTVQANIKQYIAPGKISGQPEVKYNKNRLTLKEPWTICWNAAPARNNTSHVGGYIGYTCELYINNDIFLCKVDVSGHITDEQVEYTINDPEQIYGYFSSVHTLKPGDRLKYIITPFAYDGKNNRLFGESSSTKEYILQNAGIMYVKVNGEYREGQVYVKVDSEWREAESIHVKANGEWREAE